MVDVPAKKKMLFFVFLLFGKPLQRIFWPSESSSNDVFRPFAKKSSGKHFFGPLFLFTSIDFSQPLRRLGSKRIKEYLNL